MSQTNAILATLGILLVIIAGYFLVRPAVVSTNGDEAAQAESVSQSTQATSSDSRKMAFMDFMKRGGSYKCSITQSIGGMDTKGTMYMHKGMVRGEYGAKIQGADIDTTLVVRDGYTYTWSSMAPNMGFRMKAVGATVDKNVPTTEMSGFDASQIGDYDCEPWSGNTTTFDLPKSITFTDIK